LIRPQPRVDTVRVQLLLIVPRSRANRKEPNYFLFADNPEVLPNLQEHLDHPHVYIQCHRQFLALGGLEVFHA
jgi:hypothetical protein